MKKIDINELNDYSVISTVRNEKLKDIEENGYNVNTFDSYTEVSSIESKTSILDVFNNFIKEQLIYYGLDMYLKSSNDFKDINALKNKYYELVNIGKIDINKNIDFILKYVDSLLKNQKLLYFDKKIDKENIYIVCSDSYEEANKILYEYCKDINLDEYEYLKQYIEKKRDNELDNSKRLKRK